MANIVDHDQTAFIGAVSSGSTLFASIANFIPSFPDMFRLAPSSPH